MDTFINIGCAGGIEIVRGHLKGYKVINNVQ